MSTLSLEDVAKPRSFATQDSLLIIAIGMIVCLPLCLHGLPLAMDLFHHYRTALGFHESIVNGNYYPSWHPSTNGGYGDVSVRFYPPALYFMLSGFRIITHDWFLAGLLTVISLTIAGVWGMYLWACSVTSRYCALAAGLLYALSPFHANELYQAGLFGQYAAASVLPFAFAFVERIIRGGRNSDVALLGLSYGLLVLCNVPLAVLGSISIAVYCLIRLVQDFKVGSIFRLVIGIVLGLGLSCLYWLPVLREIKWKYPSGIGRGAWFDYRNNFLFRSSPSEMSNFLLPLLVIATIMMAAPSIVLLVKKDRRALAPVTVAVFGFLMSTSLSKPIWDRLPLLQEMQFPYRWMTITSAAVALLAAVSFSEIYPMSRSRLRLSLIFSGLVLIALSLTIFQVIRGASLFDRVTFNQQVESLKGSHTNQDFLPIWAQGQARKMNSEVDAGGRAATIVDWSAERKVFSLEEGEATNVRLKTYYYPYWLASANGQRLATTASDDGALMVGVPQEKVTVVVEFTEPFTTYIAGAVSVVALLIIVWFVVSTQLHNRRNLRAEFD